MSWVPGVVGSALSLGTPLVIAGAGEVLAERAGVLNIGLEGTMLASAFSAFYFSGLTGNPYLGLLAGILSGILLAVAASYFIVLLAGDQVVIGTGINLFALGVTGTLFSQLYGKTGKLLAVPSVPKFGGILNLNALMFVAAALVAASWLILRRTRWGLALRAAGEYPPAARAAGFSPSRLRFQAMVCAGAAAGLAGAYLSVAQTNSFANNMTEGRGFVVIAAVTFGRWSALGTAAACLLISTAYGLKYLVISLNLIVPPQLFDAMPYIIALAVLGFAGRGGNPPAALATPIDNQR